MERPLLRHSLIRAADLELHAVESGRGPTVVLLHGFPDFWYGWRFQIPALADAGFRAVAPDLPGYNESDRPRELREYRVRSLVERLGAFLDRASDEPVVLVGHDWGGVLAWWLAARHPERVDRLVVLNAPHPRVFQRLLTRPTRQLLRSWYTVFFQLPWLPEAVIRAGDFRLLASVLRAETHRVGALTDEDLERYRDAFRRPGALRAALNYYRAVRLSKPMPQSRRTPRALGEPPVSRDRRGARRRRSGRVDVPTLVIWGERDPHLDTANLEGLRSWVPDLRVERVSDAGHWVHWDAPERVNRWIVEFARGEVRR